MKLNPGFYYRCLLRATVILNLLITFCHKELPEAPILISPQDGAEFTSTPPEFVWHSDPNADSYLLRITQDSISSTIVILTHNTPDTIYELSQDDFDQLPSDQYAWAVASLTADNDTVWSTSRTFTISNYEVGDILISPRDGKIYSTPPFEFVWKTYETQKGYLLRVVRDNFLTGDALIQDSLTDTTYSTPDTVFNSAPNGNYIWSVAPIPDTGKLFWWEFRSFTIEKPLPNGPDLISPLEDETISETPPTFTWHKESLAEYYRIKVYGEDSPIPDTIILDTVSDTTYSLSQDDFDICFNGKYAWKVSAIASGGEEIWCDPQVFYIDKPLPSLDLDTTYFPLGLNYSWVYEVSEGEPGWTQPYDTITVRVEDSTALANGWSFDINEIFHDVGNPARIINHIVPVFGNRKVYINPNPINTYSFKVCYYADTVSLKEHFYKQLGYDFYEVSEKNVYRFKGIGVTFQYDLWYQADHVGPFWVEYNEYRLLYFIKGEDTMWRCENCP